MALLWKRRMRRLEFRIPISPNEGFFSQVRLFNFALRRLGGVYADACLRIVVGDHCNLDEVRRQNRWSEADNIVWDRVPDALFEDANIWGTANWRLSIEPGDADIVILSDADTVLLRDIDPILAELDGEEPLLLGHMAHYPPPLDSGPAGPEFWSTLFEAYGAPWQGQWHRCSMDTEATLPLSPPYYNLGFVAMNKAALVPLGLDIHWTEAWLKHRTGSHMRCQIALPLIAAGRGIGMKCLPAGYNAANDPVHFAHNGLSPHDIRVLHYLREVELERMTFLLPGHIDAFLEKSVTAPGNDQLQDLVRHYREGL